MLSAKVSVMPCNLSMVNLLICVLAMNVVRLKNFHDEGDPHAFQLKKKKKDEFLQSSVALDD